MKRSRPRQSPRYHEKRIGCTASNRCPRLFARTTLNGSSPGARSLNAVQGLSLSAEVNVKRLIGQDPETRTPCPQISPVLLSYDLLRTTYGRPTYSLGGDYRMGPAALRGGRSRGRVQENPNGARAVWRRLRPHRPKARDTLLEGRVRR